MPGKENEAQEREGAQATREAAEEPQRTTCRTKGISFCLFGYFPNVYNSKEVRKKNKVNLIKHKCLHQDGQILSCWKMTSATQAHTLRVYCSLPQERKPPLVGRLESRRWSVTSVMGGLCGPLAP